ncbi:MAG: hypothetical protein ABI821_18710, partial [Pseudomonadota bacterium]
MPGLRISEASQKALRARLASAEGEEALMKLARLIADSAIDELSPDLRATSDTPEGTKAFLDAWPDLVSAFLFRGSRRAPAKDHAKKSRKEPGRQGRKRSEALERRSTAVRSCEVSVAFSLIGRIACCLLLAHIVVHEL